MPCRVLSLVWIRRAAVFAIGLCVAWPRMKPKLIEAYLDWRGAFSKTGFPAGVRRYNGVGFYRLGVIFREGETLYARITHPPMLTISE